MSMEEICPQCFKAMTGTASRLVQDTCGHKKCRICLLKEENGCHICKEFQKETSVISPAASIKNEASDASPAASIKNEADVSDTDPANFKGLFESESCVALPKFSVEKNDRLVLKTVVDTSEPKLNNCESYPVCQSKETILKQLLLKYDQNENNVIKNADNLDNRNDKKLQTSLQNQPIKCNECEQTFSARSHLQWHERQHSGEKPFVCSFCDKAYSQKSKLNRHLVLHAGDRPFCEQCDKTFANKDALRRHRLIHSGIKPFGCPNCPVRFAERSNLNKHITMHTGDRPFMCDVCGKCFALKWRLKRHKFGHTRERPFACTECPRAFNNSKDLNRHLVVHSGMRPFSCELCATKFRRKDNLERHMKNTHPETRAVVQTSGGQQVIQTVDKTEQTKTPVVIQKTVCKKENTVIGKVPDSANAINVIKPCKSVITSREKYINDNATTDESLPKTNAVPVINGPVKLAFKTSEFKNNYNIRNKEMSFPNDNSVNIYQKIMSPMSSGHREKRNGLDSNSTNPIEKDQLQIHYETSFDNRKHAIIKNIKFKLPPEYTARAASLRNRLKERSGVEKKFVVRNNPEELLKPDSVDEHIFKNVNWRDDDSNSEEEMMSESSEFSNISNSAILKNILKDDRSNFVPEKKPIVRNNPEELLKPASVDNNLCLRNNWRTNIAETLISKKPIIDRDFIHETRDIQTILKERNEECVLEKEFVRNNTPEQLNDWRENGYMIYEGQEKVSKPISCNDDVVSDSPTYATLLPVEPILNETDVQKTVADRQNCVRTITKVISQTNIYSEVHWRRRTSQILQPKLNSSV